MLLELLEPHMNSLSTNAADIVARIEGDVKVVRMRETRFKECSNGEKPPGIQLTRLDMPGMEAQEMASQIQAMEAMRQAEEEEEKAKRARTDAGKSPKRSSLTESLNNAANSIKDQRPETPMKTASSSSSSTTCLQGICEDQKRSDGNTHASCRDRLERFRRDSENQHSKSGTRPFQAVLKEGKVTMRAEENRCAEGAMRGSRPSNRMKPRREDSEFIALEFDSTLGYPGGGPPRVPDFVSMERCNSCDLAPWRVSRGGNARKCERCTRR